MGRARGLHMVKAASGGRDNSRAWSEARIEHELREFTRRADTWPARLAFEAAGRRQLWRAVRAHGGIEYWAERLGLPLRSQQERRSPSEEELVRDAREVIAREGRLPNAKRLRAAGYPKLATAVMRAGGAEAFRKLHKL